MSDGVNLPLIVKIGNETRAGLMNDKAFNKSREGKVLWVVHPVTGRVLNWPGEPEVISLEQKNGFYEAELPKGSSLKGGDWEKPEVDIELHTEVSLENSTDIKCSFIDELSDLIKSRKKEMPEGSYTTLLFSKGMEKIKKKTGEEAIELMLATEPKEILYESADLIYHLLVLLEESGLSWSQVVAELKRREG